MKNILVIASHSHNEVRMSVGIISKLAKEGNYVPTIILSEGLKVLQLKRDNDISVSTIDKLHFNLKKTCKILGTDNGEYYDLFANGFYSGLKS